MFAAEPQPTQFDLHFKVFGIPVRVHPFFWLAGIMLGASRGGFGSRDAMVMLLIWIGVLFFSILIHELGHALTMRYFGSSPRIVLYMMGGLAIPESSFGGDFANRTRQPRNAILIAFAGPAAGFLLAAVVIAGVYAAKGEVSVVFDRFIPFFIVQGLKNQYLTMLVHYLLYFNIFWGLVNLLPVYPLDGGQISREAFMLHDSYHGVTRSLWLSVFTGAAVCVLAMFQLHNTFMAIFFGMLAFSSYQALSSFTGRGGGFGGGGGGYGRGGPW